MVVFLGDGRSMLEELRQLNAGVANLISATTNPTWVAGDELARRASLALTNGWYADAARDAKTSLERYPYRPAAHLVWGLAELHQRHFDEAELAFRKGILYASAGEEDAAATMAMLGAHVPEFSRETQLELLEIGDRALNGRCPELRIELASRRNETIPARDGCAWLVADGQLASPLPEEVQSSHEYQQIRQATATVLATWAQCVRIARINCKAIPERPDHEPTCLLWHYEDSAFLTALATRDLVTQVRAIRDLILVMNSGYVLDGRTSFLPGTSHGTHTGGDPAVQLKLVQRPGSLLADAVSCVEAQRRPPTPKASAVQPRKPGPLADSYAKRLYEACLQENRRIDQVNAEALRIFDLQNRLERPPVRALMQQLEQWAVIVPPTVDLVHPLVSFMPKPAAVPARGPLSQTERRVIESVRQQEAADAERAHEDLALTALTAHTDTAERLLLAAQYWTYHPLTSGLSSRNSLSTSYDQRWIATQHRRLWAAGFPEWWAHAEEVPTDIQSPPWDSARLARWFSQQAKLRGLGEPQARWGAGFSAPRVWLFHSTVMRPGSANGETPPAPLPLAITRRGDLLSDDLASQLSLAGLAAMARVLGLEDLNIRLR